MDYPHRGLGVKYISYKVAMPVLFVFNLMEAVFLDVRRPNTAQLASDEART